MFPVVLDALWQTPDPDEALNQFERLVAAAGPRTAYLELLAARPDLLTNLLKLCARGELSPRCSSRSRSCSAPSPIPRPSPRGGARRSSGASCRPSSRLG